MASPIFVPPPVVQSFACQYDRDALEHFYTTVQSGHPLKISLTYSNGLCKVVRHKLSWNVFNTAAILIQTVYRCKGQGLTAGYFMKETMRLKQLRKLEQLNYIPEVHAYVMPRRGLRGAKFKEDDIEKRRLLAQYELQARSICQKHQEKKLSQDQYAPITLSAKPTKSCKSAAGVQTEVVVKKKQLCVFCHQSQAQCRSPAEIRPGCQSCRHRALPHF